MMMPRLDDRRRFAGCCLSGMFAAALIMVCLMAGAPAAAKTITCGNATSPATQQKLKDVQAAQGYAEGDDLDVVGNCLVEGGLMGNTLHSYRFGKVNIYSMNVADSAKCPLTVTFNPDGGNNCGGSLVFKDEEIDFRAYSIIIEKGGGLIAGSRTNPIGTDGVGPNKTSSHVLTITLYGADPGIHASGAPCRTPTSPAFPACGIPSAAWGGGTVALPGMPATYTDKFYKYEPLFIDDGDANAYFGNKVLAVSYGGTLRLFGKKGAAKDVVIDTLPTNSFNSWRRLDKSMLLKQPPPTVEPFPGDGTLLSVEQPVDKSGTKQPIDWEKGDDVVVTTTDYLPGHSEQLKIFAVQSDKKSFTVCNPSRDACDITKPFPADKYVGVNWRHNGERFPLATRTPDPVPSTLGIDSTVLANGAETRAGVALLSRSIVIRSGGDGPSDAFPTIAECVPPPVIDPVTLKNKCYYGGHTVARQGFQALQVQGVEFAQLGQGGRSGHYPVHFHMARRTPVGTTIADSSINESMTRWIVLHATQDVLLARNVGWKSIGHGFYLEEATEVNNKLYANLGIFARAAVVSHKDADLDKDANPRKVPGILAQRLEIPPTFKPTIDDPSGAEADRFPFHSDFNHPSVFWIMNGWNDFIGNMAAGAGMCGACYWLVPGANSGHSRMMDWLGYASLQKLPGNAATTPLKSFFGNFCSSAEFAFMPLAATTPCKGLGSVDDKKYSPVVNPLAPDTCLVKGGDGYPTKPSDCVRIQPEFPPPPPPPPPALVSVEDLNYYPTVGDGGRFPLKCDETQDCSGKGRCGAIDKTVNGVKYTSADVNPECAVTVLDHFTTSFNWAATNFAAVLLRPQWYLLTNNVITDVQNGGVSFVTGGDYSHSSAAPGLWQLIDHSVFIGNNQTNSPFAENDGPINPNSGLKCDQQDSQFCILGNQQWNMTFENFAVNQRLFNIYDGPSNQADNAYLDITPRYFDKCGALKWDQPGFETDATCWRTNYPIAFGPIQGIMRDSTHKENTQTVARCFMPNAAIGWKQPNGFYYPPSFHSSNLFFSNVDIRHFVTEPVFTGSGYKTDDGATKNLYCKRSDSGIFVGFSDVDRQTVLNDDDGSLTGLVDTLSVNKLSPFFTAPFEADECASQVGVTNITPAPPAPQPTAKTSPYDYVTSVVLPGCTQDSPTVPNRPLSVCGCDAGGNNCSVWSRECSNETCPGVRLYRQFKTASETAASYVRMGGQNTFQRSSLTANNGTYYVDTTYTQQDQINDGFSKVNIFQGGKDVYVYFIFAKGAPSPTKQDYQIYTGDNTVKPFLTRTDISVAPYKVRKTDVNGGAFIFPWKWDYNAGPGVLTVHVDMTPFAAELSTKPLTAYNSLCQPQTFCATSGTKNACSCSLKSDDPLVMAHALGRSPKNDTELQTFKKEFLTECDNVCGTWAVKDLDCPVGGCVGFGVTLPGNFDPAKGKNARPAQACFPKTAAWKFPGGFTRASSTVAGARCTYPSPGPAGKFCP